MSVRSDRSEARARRGAMVAICFLGLALFSTMAALTVGCGGKASGQASHTEGCPAGKADLPSRSGNSRSARALVPAGATSLVLCRYGGTTSNRAGLLIAAAQVTSKSALSKVSKQFEALRAVPRGAISCPSDSGELIYGSFGYGRSSPASVFVGLSGCRLVYNGRHSAGRYQLSESLRRSLLRYLRS